MQVWLERIFFKESNYIDESDGDDDGNYTEDTEGVEIC